MIKFVKVYKINGRLVVANDITSAIDTYKEQYSYEEIKSIYLIEGDDYCSKDAIIVKE